MRPCLVLLASMLGLGCAEGDSITDGGGDTAAGGAPGSGGQPQGGQPAGAGTQGGDTSTGAHAEGGEGGVATGGAASGGAPNGGGGQGGGGVLEQACPPDQFATGFDGSGNITCATIDVPARQAVNAGCDLFLGISDNCGACAGPPLKWGRVNGAGCALGLGADNTCSSANLGGATVSLFGLNTDGDVDDNDKLFAGFSCDAGIPAPGPGPCAPGELVVGVDGDVVTCDAVSVMALDYVRNGCTVFAGWRDDCDACTTAPSRWGSASTTACSVGVGGNTCAATILGADTVQLLGLDLDGDVDGNDKLYLGMRCAPALPAGGPAPTQCPAGQYVIGTHADGSVECASAAPQLAAYVSAHCCCITVRATSAMAARRRPTNGAARARASARTAPAPTTPARCPRSADRR